MAWPDSLIRSLPVAVTRLMAAGEVIDSPAAALRELLDNAIDAGATRLAVGLWLDRAKLRVADNGAGMTLADLHRAAQPHSTSKIRDRDDLHRITSLGFRGEALHGLAQLSELTIASRPRPPGPIGPHDGAEPIDPAEPANQAGETTGWQAAYNHEGDVTTMTALAIAPGTIVTVADLFGPWPARRESLPSLAKQYKAVHGIIQGMAIAHPGLAWQVYRDDRLWFALSPGRSAQDLLPQWLPNLRPGDLQTIRRSVVLPLEPASARRVGDMTGQITATVGLPDRCHRRRPDWVRLVLNGRSVVVPELEQAIVAAFGRTLPRDRQPIAIVALTVPPTCIDWNRTPAKTELYLKPLEFWQTEVKTTIAQAIAQAPNHEATYQIRRASQLVRAAEAAGSYSVAKRRENLQGNGLSDVPGHGPDDWPGNEDDRSPTDPADPTDPGYARNAIDPADPATLATRSIDPNSADQPPGHRATDLGLALPTSLKAVAQVNQTYIVAEHPGGVWLVEQHIAHERVLFEDLCDRWQVVDLATPILLDRLSDHDLDQLGRLGLDIAEFGNDLWAVRSLPAPLAGRSDAAAALRELAAGADLESAQVAIACRTAIRNGTSLTLPEMQDLLDRWQRSRHPRTCPHGRPIYLPLDESSLARFFRRHWVIGKSHGI